jgi:hypothetical protein
MKVFLFVLLATVLESFGDSVIRMAIYNSYTTPMRLAIYLGGAVLLAAYGTSLNFAPVEFASVVGLYVALLFIMFQVTNFLFFRALPTTAVWLGGSLVVAGGLIVYFGTRAQTVTH